MLQVAEYPLFVKSTFLFHITRHSRQIISPYIFADEGWEISAWDLFSCYKSFFSQCNFPPHFTTTSTVFSHQTSEVTKLFYFFQVLTINFDPYRSSFHLHGKSNINSKSKNLPPCWELANQNLAVFNRRRGWVGHRHECEIRRGKPSNEAERRAALTRTFFTGDYILGATERCNSLSAQLCWLYSWRNNWTSSTHWLRGIFAVALICMNLYADNLTDRQTDVGLLRRPAATIMRRSYRLPAWRIALHTGPNSVWPRPLPPAGLPTPVSYVRTALDDFCWFSVLAINAQCCSSSQPASCMVRFDAWRQASACTV